MAKKHPAKKIGAKKTAARKPATRRKIAKKRPLKTKPKRRATKPAPRRATVTEPVARQMTPCDCEANAELDMHEVRRAAFSPRMRPRGGGAGADGWRVARSLLKLRAQVNARAPDRDKSSDGTIGDTSHQNRNSDHNPWVDDGVVTAMDITHDPRGGCDVDTLAESIRAAHDRRVKYLIWNRRICNHAAIGGAEPWTWRPYRGANPHDQHLHVSVKSTAAEYDDTSDWAL